MSFFQKKFPFSLTSLLFAVRAMAMSVLPNPGSQFEGVILDRNPLDGSFFFTHKGNRFRPLVQINNATVMTHAIWMCESSQDDNIRCQHQIWTQSVPSAAQAGDTIAILQERNICNHLPKPLPQPVRVPSFLTQLPPTPHHGHPQQPQSLPVQLPVHHHLSVSLPVHSQSSHMIHPPPPPPPLPVSIPLSISSIPIHHGHQNQNHHPSLDPATLIEPLPPQNLQIQPQTKTREPAQQTIQIQNNPSPLAPSTPALQPPTVTASSSSTTTTTTTTTTTSTPPTNDASTTENNQLRIEEGRRSGTVIGKFAERITRPVNARWALPLLIALSKHVDYKPS